MNLKPILQWLSGKKGVISTIIMGIAGYLAAKGYVGEAEMVLITIMNGALFGAASYATGKIVYNK